MIMRLLVFICLMLGILEAGSQTMSFKVHGLSSEILQGSNNGSTFSAALRNDQSSGECINLSEDCGSVNDSVDFFSDVVTLNGDDETGCSWNRWEDGYGCVSTAVLDVCYNQSGTCSSGDAGLIATFKITNADGTYDVGCEVTDGNLAGWYTQCDVYNAPNSGYFTKLILTVSDINMSSWMTDTYDQIKDRPVYELVIPGTHDSGTYDINSSSVATPDAPSFMYNDIYKSGMYNVLNEINSDYLSIGTGFAHVQDMNFTDQLDNGVRYFDLRLLTFTRMFEINVGDSGIAQQLAPPQKTTSHGYQGAPWQDFLDALSGFMANSDNQKEIFWLDMRQVDGNMTDLESFMDDLNSTFRGEILGFDDTSYVTDPPCATYDYTAAKNLSLESNVSELLNNCKRIIVSLSSGDMNSSGPYKFINRFDQSQYSGQSSYSGCDFSKGVCGYWANYSMFDPETTSSFAAKADSGWKGYLALFAEVAAGLGNFDWTDDESVFSSDSNYTSVLTSALSGYAASREQSGTKKPNVFFLQKTPDGDGNDILYGAYTLQKVNWFDTMRRLTHYKEDVYTWLYQPGTFSDISQHGLILPEDFSNGQILAYYAMQANKQKVFTSASEANASAASVRGTKNADIDLSGIKHLKSMEHVKHIVFLDKDHHTTVFNSGRSMECVYDTCIMKSAEGEVLQSVTKSSDGSRIDLTLQDGTTRTVVIDQADNYITFKRGGQVVDAYNMSNQKIESKFRRDGKVRIESNGILLSTYEWK